MLLKYIFTPSASSEGAVVRELFALLDNEQLLKG